MDRIDPELIGEIIDIFEDYIDDRIERGMSDIQTSGVHFAGPDYDRLATAISVTLMSWKDKGMYAKKESKKEDERKITAPNAPVFIYAVENRFGSGPDTFVLYPDLIIAFGNCAFDLDQTQYLKDGKVDLSSIKNAESITAASVPYDIKGHFYIDDMRKSCALFQTPFVPLGKIEEIDGLYQEELLDKFNKAKGENI